MNIGIITAEGYDYPPTKRLGDAAAEKGHRIIVVDPIYVWPVLVNGRPELAGELDISMLDVVLPRQGATVNDSSLKLVPHLHHMGVPLVNKLDAIRLAKDQFLTLQALSAVHIPIPDTGFINAYEGFQSVLARLGGYPVVIKQVSGRVGEGVFLVNNDHKARLILHNNLETGKGILVQRFIPPENRLDIRVFVLGGKVVGAMKLKPDPGDFRSNFHLTQKSWPVELSPEWEEIALKATSVLGLEIAGVDLIVDKSGKAYVIELNYSPGFTGLEAATGLDIAGRIIDYVVETYGQS
ncbi:MAG: RimK family alpha-L-glutamate ligase [Deltaproteobacteria bacterium]|nr:RimK family alpha-L-glutamate ligase [Deltaproteobacteria bacterium]